MGDTLLYSPGLISQMSPKLPSGSASVEEVRRYIAQVLESEHGAASDNANGISDKWQLGNGSIFRDTNLQDLEEIFGINAGICVFQCRRKGEDAEWCRSFEGICIRCKLDWNF